MPQFFSGKNVDEKKVFPLRGSGLNQLLAGLCILTAALASFYYKDILSAGFFRSAGQWDETAFLMVSHLDIVSRHAHLCAFRKLKISRYIRRSEIKLRSVSVEERSISLDRKSVV